MTTGYSAEHIQDDHLLEGFSSGEPSLDEWLVQSALHAERMNNARTYVWAVDRRVVAYYTICGHEVARGDLPPRLARGSMERTPALLIARLALDEQLHGQGQGGALLYDALKTALQGVEISAGRFIVVDAIHEEAARFYEHHHFARFRSRPLTLAMKSSDAARALGVSLT